MMKQKCSPLQKSELYACTFLFSVIQQTKDLLTTIPKKCDALDSKACSCVVEIEGSNIVTYRNTESLNGTTANNNVAYNSTSYSRNWAILIMYPVCSSWCAAAQEFLELKGLEYPWPNIIAGSTLAQSDDTWCGSTYGLNSLLKSWLSSSAKKSKQPNL